MTVRLPYRKLASVSVILPSTLDIEIGFWGSGTLETWSKISKIRFAPEAAFCVLETMRLMESRRV